MMNTGEIHLTLLSGILVFFSPAAVEGVSQGSNFFELNLADTQRACELINLGLIGIADFGGQGTFWLSAMPKSPLSDSLSKDFHHSNRLPMAVQGGCIFFKDLFETYSWDTCCESTPRLDLKDGFYEVEILTRVSPGLSIGSEQEVLFVYSELDSPACLNVTSIPQLYDQ